MIIVAHILFWISVVAIFYTYILYPILMRFLAGFKVNKINLSTDNIELPIVSILMAAHNEEAVIEGKLKSLSELDYSNSRLEILIGSDHSTDKTNQILDEWIKKDKRIKATFFNNRTGKIGIINHLQKNAKGEILLLTDANVILSKDTLKLLVDNFNNSKVGLVDTKMVNYNLKTDGISYQEKSYISKEVLLKTAEGKLFGSMMGPFGGCFAIRNKLFKPVPNSFLVDDFYMNMIVLEQGFECVNEPNAFVYEDISNDLHVEFKRKVRISTGNFQNLFRFWKLLFQFNGISFTFFSHKVLRWFGPFFLIFGTIGLLNLISHSLFYFVVSICSLSLLLLTQVDLLIFLPNKVNFPIVRYFTHFLAMNLALFIGFIKFLSGVKSSIWEPTARHQ
jgi:cellulose synthase/poly-beta-1,6-N-acetylglucosamine synthase-like glycosyltransferase